MSTKVKRKKSIMEFGNGAILEKIDNEYAKVLQNIKDLNTDPTKAREITIKLKITADYERNNPTILASVTSKLMPVNPVKINLFDVKTVDEKTGEQVEAQQEASGIAPGQINLDGQVHIPEIYVPTKIVN